MTIPIVVPVVAHRMFGTRYTPSSRTPRGRRAAVDLAGSSRRPTLSLPAIDRDHGTRRSLDEIQEMFHPEGRWPYAAGGSVNELWQRTGIRFLLVGVVDQMIESECADLFPLDPRLRPPLERFRYPNAINVYYCRVLEGATGWTAHDVHPERPDQKGHVLISDDCRVSEGSRRPQDSWRLDAVVIAHELGHALTLPHASHATNLMYGGGTGRESVELTPVQELVAKQHGRHYPRPWFRHDDAPRATEVPHARGYLGARLPPF